MLLLDLLPPYLIVLVYLFFSLNQDVVNRVTLFPLKTIAQSLMCTFQNVFEQQQFLEHYQSSMLDLCQEWLSFACSLKGESMQGMGAKQNLPQL